MRIFYFIFALIFLISSCAPATTVVPSTKSPTATIIPTSTHTLTPSPTFTPTLTPTPTLIPRMPITAENAKDIQLLHQISGLGGADIAWSPDGKLIALARDHEIILFDPDTQQKISSITTDYSNEFPYPHIMFSYDGTRVLIAGMKDKQGGGQIFDIGSGQEISKFETIDEVTEFCAPGKVLASYQMKPNFNYFCLSLERVNSLYYNTTLAFSPDESYRVNETSWIFELSRIDNKGTWQRIWHSYPSYAYPWGDGATSADFSPNGRTLAAGFSEGDIHFYQTQSGVERYSLVVGQSVSGLSFSPDGNRLAYASRSGSGIIDLLAGYKIMEFGGTSPGSISDIEFSPDGRWLATANQVGNVMLWSTQSGELVHLWFPDVRIKPHKIAGGPFCQSWAGHLAFSPDGQHVALTRNGTFQMVELNSRQILYERQIEEATSIVFSPDGQFLATGTSFAVGGEDTLPQFSAVQVFRAKDGTLVHTLRGIPSARWGQPSDWNYNCVVDMAFTPDSRTLAVADVESVRFWDMQNGEQVWRDFDPKLHEIQDIDISADGAMLAAIDRGGRVKIFPFKEDQLSQYPIQSWNNLRSGHLAFSPDGSMLSFSYYKDRSIVLDIWPIPSNKKIFSEVIRKNPFYLYATDQITFSSDGRLFLMGSGEDGIISIYGLEP